MEYRYEVTSVEGLVQHVAVSLLRNGYFFWVAGSVPEGKDPWKVDEKLLRKYGIRISKWTRARRKRAGIAGVHYVRFGRFFLLLATHGKHRFFEEEKEGLRDARKEPITCFGYSLSFRHGHSCVRIEREEYRALKAYLLELAAHRRREEVEEEFRRAPFEPYAPVRVQLVRILRAVNRVRKAAGFQLIGIECVRWRRRIVKPFEVLRCE